MIPSSHLQVKRVRVGGGEVSAEPLNDNSSPPPLPPTFARFSPEHWRADPVCKAFCSFLNTQSM